MRDFILSPQGVIAFAILLVIGLGAWWLKDTKVLPNAPGGVACTQEAMQCPDGSYVGRSGPNCEFVCPAVTDSSGTPPVGGGGGILPYNSGIRGIVLAGPTCPVVHNPPDPQCADKPIATNVIISHASDTSHPFLTTQSAADGSFSVSLPPGNYVVQSGSYGTPYPRCEDVPVTVGPNGYSDINISCDTGIR